MQAEPEFRPSIFAGHTRVDAGFFGRRGGVSAGLYASLNAGPGSQDDPAAVAENRARIAATLGVAPERLLSLHQVHSATALIVEAPFGLERPQADALVTATPGLAVCALAADCAPVLLADPEAGVVGAAHAGWKGALAGVLEAAVEAMVSAGARREQILAAIGPCIAQASYEVGPEFEARFLADDRASAAYFTDGPGDRRRFALAPYCAARLGRAGIAQIEDCGRDTCAEAEAFFSNRRAHLRSEPDYGRNLSAIVLRP